MSGYHARHGLAPSSLARTIACNAWVQLAEGLAPEPDRPETLEGNAADWVAKQYAKGVEVPFGADTPVKGYKVDYDMIHGAKLWAETIGYGAISGVPVIIERVHSECWGEPDGWRHDAIAEVLHVPDYKYGFDVVEVFENWQVIAYAVGLLDMLGLDDQRTEVRMKIVQPRAHHRLGPVRDWIVKGDELRAYATLLRNACASALRPKGSLMWNEPLKAVAGAHCMDTYCPARFRCPTLDHAASHVAEWTRHAEAPDELSPEAYGSQWNILRDASKIIEARLSGIAAQIEAHIRAGTRIPGAKMEPGGSPLKWRAGVTVDDVLGLGNLCNPPKDMRNLPIEPSSRKAPVISPTQAIKAGVDKKLVEVYAEPTPTAMRLVPDDGSEARKAFGGAK
jgi:hypothetical protein